MCLARMDVFKLLHCITTKKQINQTKPGFKFVKLLLNVYPRVQNNDSSSLMSLKIILSVVYHFFLIGNAAMYFNARLR